MDQHNSIKAATASWLKHVRLEDTSHMELLCTLQIGASVDDQNQPELSRAHNLYISCSSGVT